MFVVANAYYSLSGNDLSSIRIYEIKMRAHFRHCLEQGRFEPMFDRCFSPESVISVEILCRCRMPWVWYHIKNPALSMVDCDKR